MDLLSSTLGAVGQVGEALDKFTGGRALRGTLAGHPRELLSILPYSDSLGITDEHQKTSGRDLLDHYGITQKGDDSFGTHALGFLADNALSPGNLLGAYGAYRAAPTVARGLKAGAKALSGLDLLDHFRGLGRFAADETGALKIPAVQSPIEAFRASLARHRIPADLGDLGNAPEFLRGFSDAADAAHAAGNDETIRALTSILDDGRHAMRGYIGGGHKPINSFLRGEVGADEIAPEHLRDIEALKRMFGGSATPAPARLYRGIRQGGVEDILAKTGIDLSDRSAMGRSFRDDGFLSTSIDPDQAGYFASSSLADLSPRGALFDLGELSPGSPTLLGVQREGELVLPPGREIHILDNRRFPHIEAAIANPKAGVPSLLDLMKGEDGHLRRVDPMAFPDAGKMSLGEIMLHSPRNAPWRTAQALAEEHDLPARLVGPSEWLGLADQAGIAPDAAKRMPAWFAPEVPGIEMSAGFKPWYDRNLMSAFMQEQGRPHHDWIVTSHPEQIARHEVGHGLHHRHVGDDRYEAMSDTALTPYEQALLAQHVSRYGATNPHEAVAEIIAGLMGDTKFHPDVQAPLQKYGGKDLFEYLGDKGLLKGLGLSLLGLLGGGALEPQDPEMN